MLFHRWLLLLITYNDSNTILGHTCYVCIKIQIQIQNSELKKSRYCLVWTVRVEVVAWQFVCGPVMLNTLRSGLWNAEGKCGMQYAEWWWICQYVRPRDLSCYTVYQTLSMDGALVKCVRHMQKVGLITCAGQAYTITRKFRCLQNKI